MPFCPNCKDEYEEGFTVCADCGAALVDALPKEPEEEQYVYGGAMNRTFLVNTSAETQTAMLTDILNKNGIPAFAQPKEFGSYLKAYAGYSVYGDDIYVDKADLEAAKEIIAGVLPEGDADFVDFPDADEDCDGETQPARKRSRLLIAGCIILPWAVFLIIVLGLVP